MRPIRLTSFRTSLPVALLLGCLSVGCTAQEPSAVGPNPTGPGASTSDFKPAPPADMAKPDDGHVEPPTLDAIVQLTEYSTVPVHGTAKADSSVLIKAMDGNTISADVGSNGRFCAEVPLKKNSVNAFELRTVDLNGNMSDPISLNVEQKGMPVQPVGTGSPAQNMAIGGAASSSFSWNHADGTATHDGNLATYAGGWQRSWAETDNVVVALSGRRMIDRIRLRAPTNCPLTASFSLWVSNSDAPSDPGTTPMAWQKIKDVPAGAANTDYTVMLPSPAIFNHVALYFDRGFIAWGDETNCGDNWNGAYYAVTDVEAWSVNNAIAPPPSAAPTCLGGGTL